MRIGSLFSGAGGLDLAALELFPGSSMAWHCEVDAAASKVLAHHWPDVPNLGDVTAVDWSAAEPVDVLTGGFPCQDVSLAGRRAGLTGESRSGLWSHMAAAIAVLRPRYVLIENVRGLLSAQAIRGVEPGPDGVGDLGGRPVLRAFGVVLGDLADLGFDAEWTCLPAAAIGAAHRRERVFVLAFPADSDSDAVRQQPEPESRRGGAPVAGGDRAAAVALLPTPQACDGNGGKASAALGGFRDSGAKRAVGLPDAARHLLPTAEGVRFAAAIRRQELASRPAPSPTESGANGGPRLSPAFAEWLMFWPAGWATDPAIGLSRTDQLRVIGNGVVPPQAVAAFSQLLLSEREGIAS
ncbi:DNA cytosine methyltransferase [Nocardia sp. NPDC050697]|uniref:DNA cytosine methyltransferase n=1 Tax=Nocardia sp. NPDC050697 TaxID=3155158 RepID=UPI0033F36624